MSQQLAVSVIVIKCKNHELFMRRLRKFSQPKVKLVDRRIIKEIESKPVNYSTNARREARHCFAILHIYSNEIERAQTEPMPTHGIREMWGLQQPNESKGWEAFERKFVRQHE